jgi:hypothetical protein
VALKNLEEAIVDRILRAIARELKPSRRRTRAMEDGSTKHFGSWQCRQGTPAGPIDNAKAGGGVCAAVDCVSE